MSQLNGHQISIDKMRLHSGKQKMPINRRLSIKRGGAASLYMRLARAGAAALAAAAALEGDRARSGHESIAAQAHVLGARPGVKEQLCRCGTDRDGPDAAISRSIVSARLGMEPRLLASAPNAHVATASRL